VVEWLDGDANRRSASADGGSKSKSLSLSKSMKHGEDGGNKLTKNGIDPDFDPDFDSDLNPDETY
jgi:hypothetical protein